jgi:hypothetical protein
MQNLELLLRLVAAAKPRSVRPNLGRCREASRTAGMCAEHYLQRVKSTRTQD